MENPQQSPQQVNPLDLLAKLGINPDQVEALLTPLVQRTVENTFKSIDFPKLLDQAIAQKLPELVNVVGQKLTEHIDARFGQLQGQPQGQPTQGQPGAMPMPARGAGNPVGQMLMDSLMKSLAPGGGGGGGLSDLANMGQVFGNVMKNVLEPVMSIYSQGQRDALSQVSALAKTGTQLPWERAQEAVGPAVTLNQVDLDKLANEVARRIRFKGEQ